MKRIGFLLLALFCLAAWRGGSTIRTLSDWQFYGSGVWSGFMAPFNVGTRVHNANCAPGASTCFSETLALNTLTIPAQTVIIWSYPSTPSGIGVWAFLQQSYGDSNGGPHTTPSVQIKNLNTLTSSHNISYTGDPGFVNFDIIYDGFLTSTAYGTDISEFTVVNHTNAATAAAVAGATPIGTTTISGIAWTVVQGSVPSGSETGQIVWMPTNQADELNVTLDLKAMFAYLVTKGVLTGNEYFNGIAIGVEPLQNGGTLTYNSWSITQN